MKTVLITGASSGIGKELAYVFAEQKYNLIITARRKNRLEEIKRDIENKHNVSVHLFDMDLSVGGSAEKLYKKVKDNKLQIDVLINNAGFGMKGGFSEIDPDKEERMLFLNMISLTKLSRLFGKDMVETGQGHIINIASTAAFQPVPWLAAYSATKAYVLSFSEAIAFELKDDNVKVTVINPGVTRSEFSQVAGFEKEPNTGTKIPTSRDVAEFTYRMMKNGKVMAIHGFMNNLMATGQRFTPRGLTTKIAGKMMK
ncbi:MAG: SDR family oxidoreductase [Chlorobi bacterium]|nr:SDR family oxidoreductase [Chlorobiota bacterium]